MGIDSRRRIAAEARAILAIETAGNALQKACVVILSLADALEAPETLPPDERRAIVAQAREVAADVGSSLDSFFPDRK